MLPNEALAACLTLHQGQTRKGPGAVPYAIHPIRVAALLSKFNLRPLYLEVALLHDVLEDQPDRVSLSTLREVFGHPTAMLVEELTRPKASTRKAYIASFRDKSPEACLVKLADRFDNLSDGFAWNPDYEPAYAEESERLLTAVLENPKVKEKIQHHELGTEDHGARHERESYRRALFHIEDNLRHAIAKARSV
jgi:(p)ppGpp synthase/HD superfamily hydrolase